MFTRFPEAHLAARRCFTAAPFVSPLLSAVEIITCAAKVSSSSFFVPFLPLSEPPLQHLANKPHLIIEFPHSLAVKYGFAKANLKPWNTRLHVW